jgi:acetyl-CoA acetyltransferase
MAIACGAADVVVAYRGANMRSGHRFGQVTAESLRQPWGRWSQPYELVVASHRVALWFHRYMHEHGLTNRDLAAVSVSARDFAATNPAAIFFGRPITIDEHQQMPWVAEPVLRVGDCCLETDAGAAIVVTTRARAARSRSAPVRVLAAARAMARGSTMIENVYRRVADLPDMALVGRQLWQQADLTPNDIDAAIIYDSFTPIVLIALESLGFCKVGTAARFVAEGGIGRNGPLPVNPNGGQLGEAYVHGFNGIVEAVRQLRGEAVNQLPRPQRIVVTAGTGLPSSGLILGA